MVTSPGEFALACEGGPGSPERCRSRNILPLASRRPYPTPQEAAPYASGGKGKPRYTPVGTHSVRPVAKAFVVLKFLANSPPFPVGARCAPLQRAGLRCLSCTLTPPWEGRALPRQHKKQGCTFILTFVALTHVSAPAMGERTGRRKRKCCFPGGGSFPVGPKCGIL